MHAPTGPGPFTRTVQDFGHGLAPMIEAIQLVVPNLEFTIGFTDAECHAVIPAPGDPDLTYQSLLKRPSSMAETLRRAFVDFLENGGFDEGHPVTGDVWCGPITSALIDLHERFPHMELEFGFLGGRVFAWMGSGSDGPDWKADFDTFTSLADAIRAVMSSADETRQAVSERVAGERSSATGAVPDLAQAT